MTECLPASLRLTRSDPSRNMARFYAIALQTPLFREVSLVQTWGRIGSLGQVRMETFAALPDARAAAETLGRGKRQRGYAAALRHPGSAPSPLPQHATTAPLNAPYA